MEIGDIIHIRARVVDFDCNPHGPSSVQVKVLGGFIPEFEPNNPDLLLWVHSLYAPSTIQEYRDISKKVTCALCGHEAVAVRPMLSADIIHCDTCGIRTQKHNQEVTE